MRYAIVISVGPPNCSAYSPDVDGCIATGQTVEETRERMQEALAFHFEGLRLYGERVPPAISICATVDVTIEQPMHYGVVIERGPGHFSAYVPDLPECTTTGPSVEETLANIREAIVRHVEALRVAGETVPSALTICAMVDVEDGQ